MDDGKSESGGRKAVLIVLDGVGVGDLPDAESYGDKGSNTLVHVAEAVGGLRLPHLASLGLGNIIPIRGVAPTAFPRASFGRMTEVSSGKDSTIGHWELAGLISTKAFPTYPSGFPSDLIERFRMVTGCGGVLGNRTASGTEIIQALGEEHCKTGYPIVYTSADSVFQIAAHESVIPLESLYEICHRTRVEVCIGEHAVGRIIARPFSGNNGSFIRTQNRRDFAVEPPGQTLFDMLNQQGIRTVSIGKTDELFAGRGIQRAVRTKNNASGLEQIVRSSSEVESGLIFANLGDFDTLYGHRNDPIGFAQALENFDRSIPFIVETLASGDLLIITADHGNDPTTPNTDHSREYVPLLSLQGSRNKGKNLGTRPTFADVAKSILALFGIKNSFPGESFLH